ncbi:type II secretion system F family protein [Puniceicoccus vermicola]|uniref:General secretion pathway protein F n=1 Tax=Puniceicoccus vermicola TaxID=388746 RepID=A0A7X1B034_9BACT|nr:type II secretion system F family protein [Puniceicoccus vermicola]MBC2603102.1 type II secretion system F family protein [Puniceicoccus vermicola]
MAKFSYTARDASGQSTRGEVEASDRVQATRRLRGMGLRPTSIQEAVSKKRTTQKEKSGKKVAPPGDVQVDAFLKMLLGLVKGGMAIGDAVRNLRDRATSPRLQSLAAAVWARLSDGSTLGQALKDAAPGRSRDTMNTVIEIGEQTGNLPPILEELLAQRDESRDVRRKLIGSLLYPTFLFGMALAVAAFLLFFLMPRVQSTVEGLGSGLSPFAAFLIGASNVLLLAAPILAVTVLIAFLISLVVRRTPEGRFKYDRFLLKVPIVGAIVRDSEVYRLCSILSLLLGSGIHASQAFSLTRQAIRNLELRRRFEEVRNLVNEGASVAVSLQQHGLLNPTASDLLKVGEETGELSSGFETLREEYRESLSNRLRNLTIIVSGAAIGGAFLFVTMVALAVVTSIFQVGNSIGL